MNEASMHAGPHASIGRRTLLAGIAAAGLMPVSKPASAAIVNMCVVGSDGWLFLVFDDVRHSDLAGVRRTAGVINQAVAILKAAKVEVAISLTPSKSRVYREYLPADFRWAPDAEKRYGTALEELRRPGTVVPDQAAMFAEIRKQHPDDMLFFKADTHWTAPGAEKAAILVASAIKDKIHLPPSTQPGTKLGAPTSVTQERNDLAAMLPQGEQSKYPFQSYMIRKPVETGGAGLLDDAATADVVVMGNSYMQPIYGFADVISEQLNRPVDLQWKVHQFSPYYDMLTFVRSDTFKKQPPKLIVWNFAEGDMDVTADNPGAWGKTAMSPTAFLTGLHQALGV